MNSSGILVVLDEDDLPMIGGETCRTSPPSFLPSSSAPQECEAWIGRLRKQFRHYEALRLTETARLRVHLGRLISAIG